jgi:hypothetical protein
MGPTTDNGPLTTDSSPAIDPTTDNRPLTPDLSPRQLAAIDLLLTGASDTDVAAALGINRKTLYRWRVHDPAFRAVLDAHRRAAYDHAADRLRAMLSIALDLLQRQLNDPYAPTALRAARAILGLASLGQATRPPIPEPEPRTPRPKTAMNPALRQAVHECAPPVEPLLGAALSGEGMPHEILAEQGLDHAIAGGDLTSAPSNGTCAGPP